MESKGNPTSDARANVHRITRSKQKLYEYETRSKRAERIYRLRRTRAEKKAIVTKLRYEVQRLMTDCENIDQVRENLKELDISMRIFKAAHDEYHAELIDEYDIEESNEYYEYEETKVSQIVGKIAKWIDEETKRIEVTIAEYMSDSNSENSMAVASGRRSPKNRKNTSTTATIRSKLSSTSSATRSKESATIQPKTSPRRQAKMEEYLLGRNITRSGIEENRPKVVLQVREEQPRSETEISQSHESQAKELNRGNCQQLSESENDRIHSDVGEIKSRPKDTFMTKRVSKSLPNLLFEKELKQDKTFEKSKVNNVQAKKKMFPSIDDDKKGLLISPRQPPVSIKRVSDNIDSANQATSNLFEFTDVERARGNHVIQLPQSTPREKLRQEKCVVTPSANGIDPPVDSNLEEYYATREKPAKIDERKITNESTLYYASTPVQQQSLPIQQLLEQQRQHINALTLPHTEVPVFNGDPIEYCGFIRAFESLIETKTASPSARLYYLTQFTRGDVQELVRSCLPMEAEEGYERARSLLKSKYGQSYKISTAYAERILKAPQIKHEDGRSLQKFSVLLTSCQNTLKEIGCINKLENPDTLQKIVEKLPFALRKNWRDVADNITEEQNREITIQDVTNFIDKRARAANHPLFGNLSNNVQESRNRSPTVESKRKPTFTIPRASYATHGEPPSNKTTEEKKVPKCPLCSECHWLSRCKAFKEKSLKERIKFTREKGLCDNCLVVGHMARSCPKESFCKVENCKIGRKHSTFLHPKNENNETTAQANSEAAMKQQDNAQPNCINSQGQSSSTGAGTSKVIGMSIVPVRVKAKNIDCVVETYAFLDPGSNTTFCTEKLVNQLGVSGHKTTLSLTTMNTENVKSNCIVVNLQVSDLDEQNTVELSHVYSCEKLPVTAKDIPLQEDVDRWTHLDGVKLPQIETTDIDLLIGSDVPKALEPKQMRESQNGGPYAIKTLLGWTINGPLGRKGIKNSSTNRIQADAELDEQFRRYCNMEFNETKIHDEKTMSREDLKALSIMKESARIADGHYEIALPWRNNPPELPNNKNAAQHRLELLKKRLARNEELHKNYTTFMEDLVKKGFAQKIPDDKVGCNSPGWYLPHHPVIHPRKPDKTRVVFDCAATYGGTSLNKKLMQGPDLTNSLIGVLTRFRQERTAVMADIEAMFYQVRVRSEDSDYLRYLWWPDGDIHKQPEEYQMLVHLFGGISSPSCASFALRKAAEDNENNFSAEAVETVKRNFYVDDCLKSTNDEQKAIHLVDELRRLLAEGGFRLTKWLSNSHRVLNSVPESERAGSVKTLDLDHLPVERALGVQWDVQSDTLGFNITVKEKPLTRRGILSVISSVYDPLGFVSPFILRAKALLQDLCRKGLGWDDVICQEDLQRWQSWLQELPKLETLNFERCFKPKNFGRIILTQLHTFSDASNLGYGAVSYLRFVNDEGQIHCAFVLGKARLTPMKQITIPRLELTAAATATRVSNMVLNEIDLPIDEVKFWTDSTCVLSYISNQEKRFKTFVANKIALIHETTQPSQWNYVNTKLNPADDASRGMSAEELSCSTRWKQGPAFLWETEDHWPQQPQANATVEENDPEIKRETKTFTVSSSSISNLMDRMIQYFSSWFKLEKHVAWLLRYRSKLLHASKMRKQNKSVIFTTEKPQPITVEELQRAEIEVLKYVQRQYFAEEMSQPEEDTNINDKEKLKSSSVKKSSQVRKLNPIMIGGLLRVGGRLRNAPIKDDLKYPVILPKKNHLVDLIVRFYHELSGHSGVEHVLSLIRQKFWPINARASVKKIVNNCFSCRKRLASPEVQKMADLPADRVQPDKPPFSHVGIDCFGPFMVKRGRSEVKRYGIVYTCLTIRAIHIEVLHSMDTHSFINSFRRFVARRGLPESVRSDNGTNFVAGNRELRESINEWNVQQIDEFMVQRNVKWIFNPPAASHQGGVWERCIRTIRKILNALTKEQTLDDESLNTLMCEIEAIVNGRPITKVSDDPRDAQCLTPNHLLLLRSGPQLPPGVFTNDDTYSRRRWRQVQHLTNTFWKRWVREYLPQLQERQKWTNQKRNVSVDDIVLIVDDNCPRSSWPLGRVLEVHRNTRDGCVRSVKVKTSSSTLVRPITKIVLLETVESSRA